MRPERLTSRARRTPEAERSDGIVYVVLPDRTSFETVDATPDRTAIATATRQLEAIRDEWLAPLVAQISDQAETIGRVTAERDQARIQAEMVTLEREQIQSERDALQARLSALEERHAESPMQASSAPQTATDDATGVPWWQFWRR
jgi:FtsZ-binding cell division protein ZapB